MTEPTMVFEPVGTSDEDAPVRRKRHWKLPVAALLIGALIGLGALAPSRAGAQHDASVTHGKLLAMTAKQKDTAAKLESTKTDLTRAQAQIVAAQQSADLFAKQAASCKQVGPSAQVLVTAIGAVLDQLLNSSVFDPYLVDRIDSIINNQIKPARAAFDAAWNECGRETGLAA